MGRRIPKWNQKKLDERVARGYGQGSGKTYKPWLHRSDVSSKGVTTRLWSPKTQRAHTFFSNVEKHAFLVAEFRADYIDYHEQGPMERELTLDIARSLGVSHPLYWGTRIPAVLTYDGLLFIEGKKPQLIDCKHSLTEVTGRTEVQFAMRHEYAQRKGYSILHITDKSFSWEVIHNLQWIRMSVLQSGYMRLPECDIDVCCTRLLLSLGKAAAAGSRQPLREFLRENDIQRGHIPGLSVFALRRLLWFHHVNFDLKVYFHNLLRGPVSALNTRSLEPFQVQELAL